MYVLLGIDAVLRITAALLFLFVAVPRLARPRPAALDGMQWFWWCLGAGITLITLAGQLFTLVNIFSAVTLLVAIAVLIIAIRAHRGGRTAVAIVHDLYRDVVLFSLNVLEGRVNVRRRLRRARRRARAALGENVAGRRWSVAGWSALVVVAAAFRFSRPFATPNLGFSDTYVHLYLVRLLQEGRQVDPAWGPYPRGMHFLLLAIHELTNIDPILLMNFFGAAVGVLMTLAVADAARRLARNLPAGLVAGLLFATMIGGGRQYFLFGGSIATDNVAEAQQFIGMSYGQIPATTAEFDVLLTVFQRQTATLPQELALVLLFPAALFLFAWLTSRSRWHLSGYVLCTSAIAATHPGVAIPLVLLCGVTVLAARAPWRDIARAAGAGAAGIALGSTWMFAFLFYHRVHDPTQPVASGSGVGSTAMYYFPFLRDAENARIVTWVAITPFLIACAAIAVVLLARAAFVKEHRAPLVWISVASLVFTLTELASRWGLPELVEVRRNASWLAMTLAILIGVAIAELARTRVAEIAVVALLVAWLWRVPLSGINDRLINYSGYGATAYAVLSIERSLEPFTWTLITYGQEFPMVLGRGFHLAAADFLEQYDPEQQRLPIPTRYVFIAVEKVPHRFQINAWAAKFSRADIEQRLQTWCFLYQLTHRDMRVFLDDEHVRVYMIERSAADVRAIAENAR
ncbi:MAG: hypothetical protein JO197_14525 [Acidobacteria bacterium]|nr:hypothetical protein [Acidobacteriota bacterium]MBV9478761.1 hypothetical protein [Acidobacteriota bacterium]